MLSLSSSGNGNALNIADMATTPNSFAPSSTLIPADSRIGDHVYILNTDADEVVMSITRASPTSIRKRVGDNTTDALWHLDFDKPVVGVETSSTVPSTQFAIRLGGSTVNADIFVTPRTGTGTVTGRSYIISAQLPEAGYPIHATNPANSLIYSLLRISVLLFTIHPIATS